MAGGVVTPLDIDRKKIATIDLVYAEFSEKSMISLTLRALRTLCESIYKFQLLLG